MKTVTVKIKGISNIETEAAQIHKLLTEDNRIRKRSRAKTCTDHEKWTEDDVRQWLEYPNVIHKVVTYENDVIAYATATLGERLVVLDRFVVARDHRRQGIGNSVINHLKAILPGLRREVIAVDVGEVNLPAQLFLKQAGFAYFRTLEANRPELTRYAFRYPPAK